MTVCRFRFAKELEKLPWSRKDRRYFLTRHEEYIGALRAATQIWIRMTKREISVDDALVIRIMNDFPGGIELHIGVRLLLTTCLLVNYLLLRIAGMPHLTPSQRTPANCAFKPELAICAVCTPCGAKIGYVDCWQRAA